MITGLPRRAHAAKPPATSMKPGARPVRRPLRTLRCGRRFYLIGRDAAVAVSVEPQDESARLFHELLAGDLAVLVFVKIAEVGVRQRGVGLLRRRELGRAEISVTVAIGRREDSVHEAFPFV